MHIFTTVVMIRAAVFSVPGILLMDSGLGFHCEHFAATGLSPEQRLCLWELVRAFSLLPRSHLQEKKKKEEAKDQLSNLAGPG